MAMAPADSYAKSMVCDLKAFALEQSSITTPTSGRDMERAKSIAKMNQVLGRPVDLAEALGQLKQASSMVPQ
jgi:hypothetical protein